MAKKKLTKEQESEIKMLLANNEMLEKTKKEAEKRGNKTSVAQIERAQQEVIDHISMIDPSVVKNEPRKTSLASKKKEIKQDNLVDLIIIKMLNLMLKILIIIEDLNGLEKNLHIIKKLKRLIISILTIIDVQYINKHRDYGYFHSLYYFITRYYY